MRPLFCSILLVLLVPNASTSPLDPEFEVSVRIDGPEGMLRERTSYKVPVKVEVVCKELSPFTANQNIHLSHHIALDAGANKPFSYEYQDSWGLGVGPQRCLDGTKMSYTFDIVFSVPWGYPAMTPLTFTVYVEVDEWQGNGTTQWNTTVAHTPDSIDISPWRSHRAPVGALEAEFNVRVDNLGNGPISGVVIRNESTHEALHFEPSPFGPVNPTWPKEHFFPVQIGEGAQEAGAYKVVYDVQYWLTDHPDYRFPTETFSAALIVSAGGGGSQVEVSPTPSLFPFVVALGLVSALARRRDR